MVKEEQPSSLVKQDAEDYDKKLERYMNGEIGAAQLFSEYLPSKTLDERRNDAR